MTIGVEITKRAGYAMLGCDVFLCLGCGEWKPFQCGASDHEFCDDCWWYWQRVGAAIHQQTAKRGGK